MLMFYTALLHFNHGHRRSLLLAHPVGWTLNVDDQAIH
jgi:hypothetical protein